MSVLTWHLITEWNILQCYLSSSAHVIVFEKAIFICSLFSNVMADTAAINKIFKLLLSKKRNKNSNFDIMPIGDRKIFSILNDFIWRHLKTNYKLYKLKSKNLPITLNRHVRKRKEKIFEGKQVHGLRISCCSDKKIFTYTFET